MFLVDGSPLKRVDGTASSSAPSHPGKKQKLNGYDFEITELERKLVERLLLGVCELCV